jgi:hypothetical protein
MIPNIDSKPTIKPFKDVSGIFVTVNFDGNYLSLESLRLFSIRPVHTVMILIICTQDSGSC